MNRVVWGSVEVYLRDENLDIEFIKSLTFAGLSSSVAGLWQSWIIRLPDRDGLRQVIIKGIRPANHYTGMALDDLSIRPCSDFSKFLQAA